MVGANALVLKRGFSAEFAEWPVAISTIEAEPVIRLCRGLPWSAAFFPDIALLPIRSLMGRKWSMANNCILSGNGRLFQLDRRRR
jgi:hypothetical protein